jgi:hypothetical protein
MRGGPGGDGRIERLADALPPVLRQDVGLPGRQVAVGRDADVRRAGELPVELGQEDGGVALLTPPLARLDWADRLTRVDGVVDVQRAQVVGIGLGREDSNLGHAG